MNHEEYIKRHPQPPRVHATPSGLRVGQLVQRRGFVASNLRYVPAIHNLRIRSINKIIGTSLAPYYRIYATSASGGHSFAEGAESFFSHETDHENNKP